MLDGCDFDQLFSSLRATNTPVALATSLVGVAQRSDRQSLARGTISELRAWAERQTFGISQATARDASAVAGVLASQGDCLSAVQIIDNIRVWYPTTIGRVSFADANIAQTEALCSMRTGDWPNFDRQIAHTERLLHELHLAKSPQMAYILQMKCSASCAQGNAQQAVKHQQAFVGMLKELAVSKCRDLVDQQIRLAFFEFCAGSPSQALEQLTRCEREVAACTELDGPAREEFLINCRAIRSCAFAWGWKPTEALAIATAIPMQCDRVGPSARDAAVLSIMAMVQARKMLGQVDVIPDLLRDARRRLATGQEQNVMLDAWLSQLELDATGMRTWQRQPQRDSAAPDAK